MERLFYKELVKWKNEYINTPLMIVGARQIGKTYLINEFCKKEFDDYIYLNLMDRPDLIQLFESDITFEQKINRFELIMSKTINENTIIFFDEIQESESLISMLKAFCESEFPYKIICAGSLLGVKIKRFSKSFPVGKVIIKHMYPMTFEEFVLNIKGQKVVDEIYRCFNNNEKMFDQLHQELLDLYYTYLCVGGFPAVINDYIEHNYKLTSMNLSILDSIYQSYLNDMTKYVANKTESLKIEKIYKSIPSQLGKENKKFQYSVIEKGGRKSAYESSLDWLISSDMILPAYLAKDIQVPLKASMDIDTFKIYINDIGLLTRISEIPFSKIMLNEDFRFKGSLAENYVVNELNANNISLYYWFKQQTAEIDVLIDSPSYPVPLEVKASDNTKSTSLNYYLKNNKTTLAYRISTKNFGISDNIKSIPLYSVFCIKKEF